MADTGDDKLVLDALSFTSPERLECQMRFDASFGELLDCMFDAVRPPQRVIVEDGEDYTPEPTRVVDRDGNQHFPDQIIQFMLWVQTKRERPDADLSEFDDLVWQDLASAYVRGRVGKAKKKQTGKRKKPSTGPDSADSTE